MVGKLRSSIVFKYIEQLIFRYKDDDVPAMSAQITYYLILAIFPFLLFLINLISFTPLKIPVVNQDSLVSYLIIISVKFSKELYDSWHCYE